MSKRSGGISKRHALDERELKFVKTYSAFGEKNAGEAYRRAYLVKINDVWYDTDPKGAADLTRPVNPRTANKRAEALKKLAHIAGWIEELRAPPGEHARQILTDTALFGDDGIALKAAEQVLKDEDKLSFRDDVEWWAEIMCAIGTEVVVQIGGAEVTVPLKSLFPQFAEATPPAAVIDKTIRTLEMYRDACREREAAEVHGDVRTQPGESAGEVPSEVGGA